MAKKNQDELDALLSSASKKYNLTVGTLDAVAEDVKFLTTGNMAIDYVMGGGVPLGRVIECSGQPSSGKTTLALQTAAELQKVIINGGDASRGISPTDRILYLDYEQAMDPEYCASLGLDVKHESFLFTQPDTLEDGADFTLKALETGRIRLVVVDSVAAMNPSAQAEADSIGKPTVAVAARLLKVFGVNLNSVLHRNNASAIFINHEMEKMQMGGRPGMPPATTTPGGVALKYFSSVRLQFRQMKKNKAAVFDPISGDTIERVMSTDVKVKVIKNKVAPPFRECAVRVRFGTGFDNAWSALQILLGAKKIMFRSGMYYFHKVDELGLAPEWMNRSTTGTKQPYIKGTENLVKTMQEHPEWTEGLIRLAEEYLHEVDSAVSEVDEEDDTVSADDEDGVLAQLNLSKFKEETPEEENE